MQGGDRHSSANEAAIVFKNPWKRGPEEELTDREGPRLYAVGDVHGDADRLREILREKGILGKEGWTGGEHRLVFTGDLTDRGDQGLEAIALVRRLQEESGGRVEALMGNHDALILSRAYEWRGEPADPECRELFILNGGRDREAKALAADDEAFAWLTDRPLMLGVGETLFQHADSARFYARLGHSVEEVNGAGTLLAATGPGAWRLFYEMTDGRDWDAARHSTLKAIADGFEAHLERFGATRVVHGHTRHTERQALRYRGGRAINVDGTLSAGYRRTPGRGFVADLGPLPESRSE